MTAALSHWRLVVASLMMLTSVFLLLLTSLRNSNIPLPVSNAQIQLSKVLLLVIIADLKTKNCLDKRCVRM